jgi:hypothetical protein
MREVDAIVAIASPARGSGSVDSWPGPLHRRYCRMIVAGLGHHIVNVPVSGTGIAHTGDPPEHHMSRRADREVCQLAIVAGTSIHLVSNALVFMFLSLRPQNHDICTHILVGLINYSRVFVGRAIWWHVITVIRGALVCHHIIAQLLAYIRQRVVGIDDIRIPVASKRRHCEMWFQQVRGLDGDAKYLWPIFFENFQRARLVFVAHHLRV